MAMATCDEMKLAPMFRNLKNAKRTKKVAEPPSKRRRKSSTEIAKPVAIVVDNVDVAPEPTQQQQQSHSLQVAVVGQSFMLGGSSKYSYEYKIGRSNEDEQDMNEWVEKLLVAKKSSTGGKICVGFDTEWCAPWWRSDGRTETVETLQFYSPSAGALVFSTGTATTLPQSLMEILADASIIKMGANVQGDGSRLVRDFENVDVVRGLLDFAKGAKLESIVNKVCPKAMHIDKKSASNRVRVSDWSSWPLTTPQLEYAANDAVLSYWAAAYSHGEQWLTPQPTPTTVLSTPTSSTSLPATTPTAKTSNATKALNAAKKTTTTTMMMMQGGATKSTHWITLLTKKNTVCEVTNADAATTSTTTPTTTPPTTTTPTTDSTTHPRRSQSAPAKQQQQQPSSTETETQPERSKSTDFFIMQRNRSLVPPNLGKKEHPQGTKTSLKGVVAVISGVLDSFNRADMSEYITQHGGKVVKAVTMKTTHLINDHGEVGLSKRAKCEKQNVAIVKEDVILELVRSNSK